VPVSDTPPLSTTELRLLAEREKNAQDKRAQRARNATEKAAAALAPNPTGYVVPPMPAGLSAIRKWVRRAHDAYSRRAIGPLELAEIRRSASSVGDLYRTGADMRKAEAAIRAAQAQEQMAAALAAVEHGGAALVLLQRLQNGLTDGPRRPLPAAGRVLPMTPPGDGT
jgi:hypothetical protein